MWVRIFLNFCPDFFNTSLKCHPGWVNDGDEELPRGFIPLLVDEEVLVHQPRHQPLQVLQPSVLVLICRVFSSILVLFRASRSLEKLPVKSF